LGLFTRRIRCLFLSRQSTTFGYIPLGLSQEAVGHLDFSDTVIEAVRVEENLVYVDLGRKTVWGGAFGDQNMTRLQILLTIFDEGSIDRAIVRQEGDTIANWGVSLSTAESPLKPHDFIFTRSYILSPAE
jgi:hypothetical protein